MNQNPHNNGAAIVVRDLRRRFGRQQVLDGVNLECPRGQITTIVGPSGCGKTVLLKHLNLLLRPDSGADRDRWSRGNRHAARARKMQIREKFGMLFQAGALFDSMSVFDNVAFPLVELTDLSREEIATRVEETLKAVGLQGMERKYPSEMSALGARPATSTRRLVRSVVDRPLPRAASLPQHQRSGPASSRTSPRSSATDPASSSR